MGAVLTNFRRTSGFLFILALLMLLAAAAPVAAQDSTGRASTPTTVTPRTQSSPFTDPFPFEAYQHYVEFDSVENLVRIRETLFGQPIGQPLTLTLDQYIAERQKSLERQMWDQRLKRYSVDSAALASAKSPDTTAKEKDLADIVGLPKEIKIPIPQNPLFSIFGEPTVSINVNGSVNVSAGWQWDNNNLTSINALGTTQSAPFFNQNIQVAVSGKVGDKLKLNADFDTQRALDIENQLKISFGGGPASDDDIIQSVEAGNVSLQTPSQLVGSAQALFGVKSSFKFGKLFLTALASQKRGERKTVSVSGGSVKTKISLKPYDYAPNHFWLDTAYRNFYDRYYANQPPAATPDMAPWNMTDIEVYEQVKDGSIPSQFKAIAYADLPPVGPSGRYDAAFRQLSANTVSGEVQPASFIKLEQGRHFEYDRQLGTLTIKTLQRDKIYAVAFKTSGRGTYGEFSNTRGDSTEVGVLRLIYVSNLQPGFKTLWTRQMKNIYQLQGVRNIDLGNSTITISYGVPPDTNEVLKVSGNPRLVEVLGVDRTNSSNQSVPDGEFDIRTPYFFDPVRGEITFPSTEPFRKGLRESPKLAGNAEQFVINSIYDQTREEAQQQDTRVGRYTIGGEIAGSGGNKINLGVINLARNSIKVSANGEMLTEGLDYRVDEVFGEVTLLSPKANSATGNIQVEFEQNDFFTIAQKTLLGLRADYDLLNKRNIKSKLGMTMMQYSQSLPTNKVQIYSGEEPVTNLAVGFDGWVDFRAPFLTKAIDALPFFSTTEASNIKIGGEIAAIISNPNNKESLVQSDAGKGAAYIDDFESGAKRQIQLGINYTLWHHSSAPLDPQLGPDDTARVANRSLFYWYNRQPANEDVKNIWPNRDVGTYSQKASILDVVIEPDSRGIYNPNLNYENNVPRDKAWGGMMRSLSFFTTNLNEENIDYIEITLRADEFDPNNTEVYLDLGQISEDVIPNLDLDTEDGATANNTQQDDVLNEGEDIGIDRLNDEGERAKFDGNETDPARDNFQFDKYGSNFWEDYRRVNGLEGNQGRESGPFPDAEDLNGNKSLDLDNSYFRYKINLDNDATRNPQIVGGGDNPNGWRQYRIPLRTGFQKIGNPSFSNVQFARVIVKSPSRARIRFAEFNMVGSDWRNADIAIGDSTRDPKLDVSFVNLEDNSGPPDFYTVPPGVDREREYSTDILKNEQSLAVRVQDLERGESRSAVRVRPRAFDMFNYKKMRFFFHGSGDMDAEQEPGQPAKVVAFIRFGWDSTNYYEYRVPLLRDWHEYTVDFGDLAAIKQQAATTVGGVQFFPVPGQPTAQFALRGMPSLTRIQFISFGVENNAYPGALTTTMWVDELRAVEAEDETDWAATFQANTKLADLGTVNYNFSRTNPNFHRLEDRFGNRVEATTHATNISLAFDKFMPTALKGTTLPFTYNHVEKIEKPRYVSESDVEVEAAAERIVSDGGADPAAAQRRADSLRTATQTLVVQDAFSFANVAPKFPGTAWYVRDIFNRFQFGYDYNQTRSRSPLIEQRFEWQWKFRGQYSTSIPQNFDVKPLTFLGDVPVLSFFKDYKINMLPTSLTFKTDVTRGRTTEQLRGLESPSPVIREFGTFRNANFRWPMTDNGLLNISTEYNLDVYGSLTDVELGTDGKQRTGGEIASDLFFNDGRLFNFGRDYEMKQVFNFNGRPRIPYLNTARYKVEYGWQDQLNPTITTGSFTKRANWNSQATLGLEFPLKQIGNTLWGAPPNGLPDTASESTIASVLRYLIKIPFLEFDRLTITYSQNNSSKNDGVLGATGISNFWGRSLFLRSESPNFGPGTAYQLGLTDDPHSKLNFGLKSAFPFISVEKEAGLRAPNIYVQDQFTQENNLQGSTSRTLWPGASLNLNWNTKWGLNQNTTITTDGDGIVTQGDVLSTFNRSRSYLSLPDWLIFSAFDNDIEGVVDEYARRKGELPVPQLPANPTGADSIAYGQATVAYNKQLTSILSETFEQQLEALNWLPGNIGKYLPRVNWQFTWNGLEKLPFFDGWLASASFRHTYTGKFTYNYRVTPDGEIPETQTVTRGFSPLAQLNLTGKDDVFGGSATGSISYNTTTDFVLVTAARSEISKEVKNEATMQLNYRKRGFSFPLFGLKLQNEIEFQTNFSYSRNNRKRFNLTDFKPEGNNNGSTKISFRPSVRYSISNAVDGLAFISYDATIPDDEGSREISRSTTKVGIEIRLRISGGR